MKHGKWIKISDELRVHFKVCGMFSLCKLKTIKHGMLLCNFFLITCVDSSLTNKPVITKVTL